MFKYNFSSGISDIVNNYYDFGLFKGYLKFNNI